MENEAVEQVCDITPSYSMLSAGDFAIVRDGLEAKGFDVKVVFLMRDPLERLWSSIGVVF